MKGLAICLVGIFLSVAIAFSAIRYNDLAEQNVDLKSKLQSLEKKVGQIGTTPVSQVDYTHNLSDGSDGGASILASKINCLEKEIADFKAAKMAEVPAQADTNITDLVNTNTFQDAVYKASQKRQVDNFQRRSINVDKKYLDFLADELALAQTQKDAIRQILNVKENALQELYQKSLTEQNFTSAEYYGQMSKINDEAETNITALIYPTQLTKFNQLKQEGKFFTYSVF